MTNEELLADLKQFIEGAVSRQMSHFVTKEDIAKLATKDDLAALEHRLGARIDILDEKIDVVQDAIADTVQDHEQRLRLLERKATA